MWMHAEPVAKIPSTSTPTPRLQAKLAIGAPGDRWEREADRVADSVIRGPTAVPATNAPPSIQRKCSSCEEEDEIRAKEAPGRAPAIASETAGHLRGLEGSGRPLSAADHGFFGSRMGHDFGSVRVHADDRAAAAASALGARAFTWGRHVVFGAGEYAPGSDRGRHLLAHELVHVAQQGRAPRQAQEPP